MKEMTAKVFNIERFASDDGKGIRTVVFLKGCALRCKWCANPESQSKQNQILHKAVVCVNCGRCIEVCPQGAISFKEGYGYITDDSKCTYCQKCVDNCYVNAREPLGKDYTVEELLNELLKDEAYFHKSNGGITFSGGEPLFYDDFIVEITKRLHERKITVLIETCGYVPKENLQKVSKYVDYIFYDIKQMDNKKHKELTGGENGQILENIKWLSKNYKGELSIRYPYIPTCNDDPKDIEAFLDFVASLKTIKEIWFLPYHRLGLPKYLGLGRDYPMGDMPSLKMKDIYFLREKYQSKYDFKIRI